MVATPEEAAEELLADGGPSPVPCPSRPAFMPYVDNANALCWDETDGTAYVLALTKSLIFVGLRYRVEADSVSSWTVVGCVLDASRRLCLPRPERA